MPGVAPLHSIQVGCSCAELRFRLIRFGCDVLRYMCGFRAEELGETEWSHGKLSQNPSDHMGVIEEVNRAG